MKSLRHFSLASRLGLLFAVLAATVFGISGVHLYQSLSRQLQNRDNSVLSEAVEQARHHLEEIEGVNALRADPHTLLDVVRGQKGMLLTIRDSAGALLVASPGSDALLLSDFSVTRNQDTDAVVVRDWHLGDGRRGRLLSIWARIGKARDVSVFLTVAREDSEETKADLQAHLEDLMWTILAGALTTALFSYIITRRGLRPLHTIAQAASAITAQQLGGRLKLEDAPLELTEMVRAFNLMLDRLEDSFRRLTQFSSDLAHDLRTPISNLMVETQVTLVQPRSVKEYETLLVSNIEEYERLTRIVENMLFLAHADNAEFVLRKEHFCCEAELRRIAEYFEGMADEADITIDVDASGSLLADPMLLRRAVSNLVANAMRYTTRGKRVTIRGYLQGNSGYVIEVSNPGVGIPAEHLPRIFDRFYRVDTSRGDSHTSFGLGLAIVKSIAALHGGSVQVESLHNGLTTFKVLFRW